MKTFYVSPNCARCGRAFEQGEWVVPVSQVIMAHPTMVENPELEGSKWAHVIPCEV